MFERDLLKEPELNFINEIEEFRGPEDYRFFGGSGDDNNETITKVQSIESLKKLKCMFDGLVQIRNNCHSSPGGKCHLFLENDEIKIKTVKDYAYHKEVSTSLGVIGCFNKGEWGGELTLTADDGKEYCFKSFTYSFENVFEYEDKVYAISSIAHMLISECALHEIKKEDGKYRIITIFECNDMYFSGYHVEDNYLYFYSNGYYNGLCRFNLDDNQLEIIHANLCPSIDVVSLMKQDNFIYIYGNYNIVKYDLNSRKIDSIYTNLEYFQIHDDFFVNGDVKLKDIWEDLIDGE